MDEKLISFIREANAETIYVLVQWPKVQVLMDEDWFDEDAILYQSFDDQKQLPSAYFVPFCRLLHLFKPG